MSFVARVAKRFPYSDAHKLVASIRPAAALLANMADVDRMRQVYRFLIGRKLLSKDINELSLSLSLSIWGHRCLPVPIYPARPRPTGENMANGGTVNDGMYDPTRRIW